jgi:hypothetical protein
MYAIYNYNIVGYILSLGLSVDIVRSRTKDHGVCLFVYPLTPLYFFTMWRLINYLNKCKIWGFHGGDYEE